MHLVMLLQVCGAFAACRHRSRHPETASVTPAVQRLDHTSFWSSVAVWRHIHLAVASAVKQFKLVLDLCLRYVTSFVECELLLMSTGRRSRLDCAAH